MGAVAGVHSKFSNSRGRPYALMLLIAFGAALLGVMLLHKFRERRICNLLLKRTDQDLHSFQLLFQVNSSSSFFHACVISLSLNATRVAPTFLVLNEQRERDRSKELEKNNEDLEESLYLLRTQKMELDRRLLELQSTIDSLRDEQKIIKIALQDKQSEIKMLREKEIETGNENSQVVVLTQSLKQKEDELEDLRRRLESHGAVAADDPSDPRKDSTKAEEQSEKLLKSSDSKGEENNESMKNNRGEKKSTDVSEGSTSKRDETETQKSEEAPERKEIEGQERQKQESLEDAGEKQKFEDGDVRKDDGEESKITKDYREKEGKDSEVVEQQKADKILKNGMKMETETGKYGHTRKTRGKRWRYIAKKRSGYDGWRLLSKKRKQENNRNLGDSGVISTTNWKFIKGGPFNEVKSKEYPEDAREEENKSSKQEELNSKNGDTLSKDGEQKGNEDVGDGSIKKNPGEETKLKDSKSEEKQEPEREGDGHFNRESNSDVIEDVKEEGNKEETGL